MRDYSFPIMIIVFILAAMLVGMVKISDHLESIDAKLTVRTIAPALPDKCREFYNDGTGRWIECMGVGLK